MGNDLNQNLADSGDARHDLVVGLDAGGTRTRAMCASAADGRLLGEGSGGPGNALTVPEPQLTDHLTEAIAAAVPESARGRVVAVAGGFAGATGTSADDPGYVRARSALTGALPRLGIPPGPVALCSDIEAAFASAPGTPTDGLALVAGTGAVAMRIAGRRATTTVDGDGWLLGDDGSGFWIGRSAVRAALRMADGRGPGTGLALLVGRAFGVPDGVLPGGGVVLGGSGAPGGRGLPGGGAVPDSGVTPYGLGDPAGSGGTGASRGGGGLSAGGGVISYDGGGPAVPGWTLAHREAYRAHLLPAVMTDPPIRLARLAPLVVEAAREKDAVAVRILDEAADQLADTVRALAPRAGEPLVATGGLLGPEGPLTEPLTIRLHALGLTLDWVADGCRGAVALARLAYGGGGR
ncbi:MULTISPECIES: N-acetylglucosamine kinase [unclassified Streptomyces]|uniref:N-acetylglucosamine kinase n=1 Tax=unclassified Streptomyces TaxID=2593676 RepID=UPI002251BFB4|nr:MULTISPECIES: BadF/BadG/BcrA/BcrD ATPase family protein [unclassified Streptomyces]MCX5330681.1 ATPase [Streptomyces sp. NBC_00140]MCX5360078.1 ATPase [Streptomyces sp. NBC_00124]